MKKRIIYLVLPPSMYVTLVYSLIKFFKLGYYIAGFLIAYFIPPAGKESIIPLMITFLKFKGFNGFTAVTSSVALITATDAITAFFVIWNFDLILLIPKIGEVLKKLETKAKNFIDKYNLSKKTYFGLFVFVFIPFQGTGTTTAGVIGRILGLEKTKLFITIVCASFSSSLFIALMSNYLSNFIFPKPLS